MSNPLGGIKRGMEPHTKVIASALFEQELQVVNEAPLPFKYIFGKNTKKDPCTFKPDHLVQKTEEISIGGLQLRLIPVSGGETADALIIYEGQNQIAVVGDILMPYFGAPWASEGSPENLLKTIGVLRELDAKDLIHAGTTRSRAISAGTPSQVLRKPMKWL